MNASTVSTDAYYSKFTMALLFDTGWYIPNWEYAEDILWGKGKGCSFLDGCDTSFPEFSTPGGSGCTIFHEAIGTSNPDAYTDTGCAYV